MGMNDRPEFHEDFTTECRVLYSQVDHLQYPLGGNPKERSNDPFFRNEVFSVLFVRGGHNDDGVGRSRTLTPPYSCF